MFWHTPLNTNIKQSLVRVIEHAKNLPYTPHLNRVPEITVANISEVLEAIPPTRISDVRMQARYLSDISSADVRFLSSEFSADTYNDLFLLPQYIDARWRAIEVYMQTYDPNVAVLLAPSFWQMGPMFYRTCRLHKVPVSVMPPNNLPVSRQLITETRAEFVTTTHSIAQALHNILVKESSAHYIRHWHIITPLSAQPVAFYIPEASVSHELFLFPGIPIGKLDNNALATGALHVYPSDQYVFEIDTEGVCYITSLEREALPFIRLAIPGIWRVQTVHNENDVLIRIDAGDM